MNDRSMVQMNVCVLQTDTDTGVAMTVDTEVAAAAEVVAVVEEAKVGHPLFLYINVELDLNK